MAGEETMEADPTKLPISAAVVGSTHWSKAAVTADVSAMPSMKHSWNDAKSTPSSRKSRLSARLDGTRSGDSALAAHM